MMIEIEDFLSPDHLRLGVEVADKAELLDDLAERAAAAVGIEPAPILAGLEQRERLGTTGIGEGVAVPHTRLAGLARLTGFFVRLAHPIDYEALDNAPVDLVFLLLAPE